MKKFISIALSILIIAAVTHIYVAEHFCGGQEAGVKVSLTAKLAQCGMEGLQNEKPVTGLSLKNHCCDDIVSQCGINSNYTPSFSFVPVFFQYNFQVLALPVDLSTRSQTDNKPLYSSLSPPGAFRSTDVDLSDICVFRI